MSFLATVGKDFKAVFAWLGSSGGQAVVAGAEGAAEAVATAAGVGAPVATGISLLNNWITEAIKTESLAAAAVAQTGTGTQKAAVVLTAMVPELTSYLQAQGITSSNVTSQATAINNAVVNLLNTLTSPATPAA